MVQRNIRAQYRNSVLGIVWTVLNPLLIMGVMAIVFSQIFGGSMQGIDYPVYVLAGNTVFNLMRMATSQSLPCMVNNYDLITKTRVPYFVFPVSNVASATVNFFFSFLGLLIVIAIRISSGFIFHWTIILTVFPFLPSLVLFSMGMSFILCTIYVRFRDISHLYSVILTLWTYLTPLFYPESVLPEYVKRIMKFNPMYQYVSYFREIIQTATVPSLRRHLACYGFGIVFFVVGYFMFQKQKGKFVLYI
jgi:ABC-2 type transport system permease protein